jgi:hypothetical protein
MNIIELECVICKNYFDVIYKKRSQKTCSKECAYKLRNITKNIKHDELIKKCERCQQDFFDISKKKLVKNCQKCIKEKSVETRKNNNSYIRTDIQNQKMVATFKRKRENGEIFLSNETRQKMSLLLKERWENGSMKKKSEETNLKKYGVTHWTKSEEGKKYLREMNINKSVSYEARIKMSKAFAKRLLKNKIFSRGKGGFRQDLGFYCRSTWEANFARILKYQNKEFLYESKTFFLNDILSYTPDFYCENVWYEIKGYMDNNSKLKLDLFSKLYPDEKICIIELKEYNILKQDFKHLIPLWEGK